MYMNKAFFPGMEWTSRINYWSCQHRGLQACLEGPGQAPLNITTFFYFYITSTNSLHWFLAHTARAQHISAEDGPHCPLQIRHLDNFRCRWHKLKWFNLSKNVPLPVGCVADLPPLPSNKLGVSLCTKGLLGYYFLPSDAKASRPHVRRFSPLLKENKFLQKCGVSSRFSSTTQSFSSSFSSFCYYH